MTAQEWLDFLHFSERLKGVTRHCDTSAGTREVVAAHSWRLTLMALLLYDEFPELDMERVMHMCIVHDLGEAVTDDIPSFLKTASDEAVELKAQEDICQKLPHPQRGRLESLFTELEARQTPEARLYKALDKLEAVMQHNESALESWIPREYELNLHYADENVAEFPLLREVRSLMRQETEEKIRAGSNPTL
jgi:putative hydrolase of HD superfamily